MALAPRQSNCHYSDREDQFCFAMHAYLLKRLRDGVVFIRWQQHVLREVDLYAMSLSDRDVWRDLHEAIHDGGCRLGNGRSCAVGEGLGTGAAINAAALRNLRRAGNHAEGNGCSEDFE